MFSQALLSHRIARNKLALARIGLAKKRILSVLDREIVAHEKTLEQKIAEQGPNDQRVDPHLISLAIMDMCELNRLAIHHHASTRDTSWYSNVGASIKKVNEKLDIIAPLYNQVSNTLSNHIGDALEIATFIALSKVRQTTPRYHFDGHFFLESPKNKYGRFERRAAPSHLGAGKTSKPPDFLIYGHNPGVICVECKNYREWIYPTKPLIKHHILRCNELGAIPLFVMRRIHYSTLTNFFAPAGIIAHESLYQYFPSDKADIAEIAKNKRSLGFTDIIAGEISHARTNLFFSNKLPLIVDRMASKWFEHKAALVDYANNALNLAQLYNVIGSRAGGKWQDPLPEEEGLYDEGGTNDFDEDAPF